LSQQDAIDKSISSVKPGGGAPLVGATILAYSHMLASALAGNFYGNEFVVLITDGAQSDQCSYAPRCSTAAACTDVLLNEEVPKAAGPALGSAPSWWEREPMVVRQDSNTLCESGANGWQYGASNTKIRLCGDICNAVRSDSGAKVDVVLGCPSVLQ
jgi:hypothetical protein